MSALTAALKRAYQPTGCCGGGGPLLLPLLPAAKGSVASWHGDIACALLGYARRLGTVRQRGLPSSGPSAMPSSSSLLEAAQACCRAAASAGATSAGASLTVTRLEPESCRFTGGLDIDAGTIDFDLPPGEACWVLACRNGV